MDTSWFVYLSVFEGLMICCMLGWEIFWLKRMYMVLQSMPTSAQIEQMVTMIKSDRDSIKTSLLSLVGAFEPLKNLLGGGMGRILGGLFDSESKHEKQMKE